jgi:hypothetical protein
MPGAITTAQAGNTSAGLASAPGHTHFAIDAAELAALRELRELAGARLAEMRRELEAAEAELAILDEALAEAAADGG